MVGVEGKHALGKKNVSLYRRKTRVCNCQGFLWPDKLVATPFDFILFDKSVSNKRFNTTVVFALFPLQIDIYYELFIFLEEDLSGYVFRLFSGRDVL